MSIYKRGNKYQANFMLEGVRFRKTFDTEEEAKVWEQQIRTATKLKQPVGLSAPSKMTIKDLVEHVVREDWAAYRSGSTQARKAHAFAEAVGAGRAAVDVLRGPIIELFLQSLEANQSLGPATVNGYAAAISKVCKHAIHLGIIPNRPRIKRRRGAGVRSEFFTRAQEEELCSLARTRGRPDYADLFVWLAETGMRLGEANALLWSDIDLDRGLITIRDSITKSDKTRVIGLSARAARVLVGRAGDLNDGPWTWVVDYNLRYFWSTLRGDLPWMDERHVLHTFRHTCASRLVQSGASLYQVKAWLGHGSVQQTERYAKFAPDNMKDMTSLLDNFKDAA